ncbi:MAG TPA: PAS domain S-box protein [Candidatus Saccharimonadales bacterium]|nr:PAS domain S-box protein [Candidatus Saccharimonadales bacterium]
MSRTDENIYKTLVEQIKDYALFMLDTSGHVMTWNEGAKRFKGYEAAEIIGKHFSAFYPKVDLDNDKPAYELKMAADLGRYEDDGWRVRKDGSRFWANVIITALRDPDGKIIGYAKVTRDLTTRKLQEDSLQKLLDSEERFRLLVEQVKDYAIFVLDPRGRISSWNQGARRLKGYSADEVIGKHFSIFYTQEDLAINKPPNELSIAIRDGRYEEEGWRLRKDGSRFWASVIITALWDKRGNLSGFAKVTRDLTARMLQEESLKQKTRELESFAHTVSHDLRAPLRSIRRYSELLTLEHQPSLNIEGQQFVERITRSADSMERLINGILQYTQVAARETELEAVPLGGILRQVLQLHDSEIHIKQARIHISNSMPSVLGDRTLLLQVFSNLVGNALKFVPEGRVPSINIEATQEEGAAYILVKDNGIGIAERDVPKIFNIFERLDTGGLIPGTGVGLAIVKRALEKLGGAITVTSVPDQGTTFRLELQLPNGKPAEMHS